jgi:hypothetical protein
VAEIVGALQLIGLVVIAALAAALVIVSRRAVAGVTGGTEERGR